MFNTTGFNQVTILFLIMCVGIYGRKKKILNEEINKGLTQILLRITLPFMIITSFNYTYSKEMSLNMKKTFLYSLFIHFILIFIGNILYLKIEKDKRDILKFVTVFSNCGFMGFPILEGIYGNVGMLYGSIFNIPFYVLIWSYGLMLFSQKKDLQALKRIFYNPGIVSVAIGLFTFSIKIPLIIENTMKLIGNMTTPISMIIIGFMISGIKIKEIFKEASIYYASFIRLILAPALTFFIFQLLKTDVIITNVAVIIQAMPVAVVCAVFAKDNNKRPEFASQAVFITTLLSIITIPIVLLFLK